jgi:myo-inositol catabolism protein IolC
MVGSRAKALSHVMVALAQAGMQEEAAEAAEEALAAAQFIQDDKFKARALSEVAAEMFNFNPGQSILIFHQAFKAARYSGHEMVFQVLVSASKPITAIDDGQTLWRVYQEIMQVDSWWGASGTTS